MLVTLDIEKHQLRAIQELAKLLEVNLYVEPELNEEQENKALYKAMQDGDQSILNEREQKDFKSWLND